MWIRGLILQVLTFIHGLSNTGIKLRAAQGFDASMFTIIQYLFSGLFRGGILDLEQNY